MSRRNGGGASWNYSRYKYRITTDVGGEEFTGPWIHADTLKDIDSDVRTISGSGTIEIHKRGPRSFDGYGHFRTEEF